MYTYLKNMSARQEVLISLPLPFGTSWSNMTAFYSDAMMINQSILLRTLSRLYASSYISEAIQVTTAQPESDAFP